jgi:hypothetical protein
MPVSILASGGMLMFVGGLMLFFTSYGPLRLKNSMPSDL